MAAECITFRLANQLLRSSEHGHFDESSLLIIVLECIGDWYIRTIIDEVVNLKDVTHLCLMVVCIWLLECLSMYVSNHCLAM